MERLQFNRQDEIDSVRLLSSLSARCSPARGDNVVRLPVDRVRASSELVRTFETVRCPPASNRCVAL